MDSYAIIGTAGRDKTKPMTLGLWEWMVAQAIEAIPVGAHVVSGGAAWADHVACELYRIEHAAKLTLHLPAPFAGHRFQGPRGSSASAANYYHELFSQVIGHKTLDDLSNCIKYGAGFTEEPAAPGYGGMFARNAKVAQATHMLAFTWGEGDTPADGGTQDTWNKCRGIKLHISLTGYNR